MILRSILLAALVLTAGCASAPPPQPQQSSVDGALTAAEVESVIAGYKKDLQKLYDAPTRGKPWRRGELRVSFYINSQGWVRDLRLTGTDITEKDFVEDVLLQISLMRFPARGEPTAVTRYPFHFDDVRHVPETD